MLENINSSYYRSLSDYSTAIVVYACIDFPVETGVDSYCYNSLNPVCLTSAEEIRQALKSTKIYIALKIHKTQIFLT